MTAPCPADPGNIGAVANQRAPPPSLPPSVPAAPRSSACALITFKPPAATVESDQLELAAGGVP